MFWFAGTDVTTGLAASHHLGPDFRVSRTADLAPCLVGCSHLELEPKMVLDLVVFDRRTGSDDESPRAILSCPFPGVQSIT
jgi:hypothetical protein